MLTCEDCHLDGQPFSISKWKSFDSDTLARIVGVQEPGSYTENLDDMTWEFKHIEVEKLRFANQDYEEPEGGWSAAWIRFLKSDEEAAKTTPEYAGRDMWLKEHWLKCTDTYPLYVVLEEDGYRLLDGHHRLAGAFYYNLDKVAIILGTA